MKRLLVLLAVCAFAAAFVARDRRAVNPDEEEERLRMSSTSSTSSTRKPQEVCAPQTPCAWSTYRSPAKIIEVNITNDYCVCSKDTVCQVNEDNTAIKAYVYLCRPPSADGEDIIDS